MGEALNQSCIIILVFKLLRDLLSEGFPAFHLVKIYFPEANGISKPRCKWMCYMKIWDLLKGTTPVEGVEQHCGRNESSICSIALTSVSPEHAQVFLSGEPEDSKGQLDTEDNLRDTSFAQYLKINLIYHINKLKHVVVRCGGAGL